MKTIYNKLLLLLLLLPFSLLAQSTVSGTVTDSKSNQSLPGVNVKVKGSSAGTATDLDGKFKLSNVKKGDVITFSYIGYADNSVSYNGQQNISLRLEESSDQLQEVQIQVGYGTVKKKDLTGSTTTISSKEFNKGANVTAENLLNGRVAGVTINTSGAPGSGSTIRIRGGSSLNASNDPLIVIDGLPIENDPDAGRRGSTSVLAALNPAIVESITVLKDASASAIYGVRAANGVIIITTKKGGKTLSVDYNFQYGLGQLVKTTNVFDGDAFRALVNDKLPARVSALGTANTNWQDAIYRKTDYTENNVSLRGNLFGFIPSRLTLGRTFQEGLRLTNEFQRNTVGVALNPAFFGGNLKVRLNANYSNENNRFADGVEGTAIRFDPTQPIYDINSPYGGFFEYWRLDNGVVKTQANTPRNPVAQLLQTLDTGRNNRLFGNFELDYKFHFLPSVRAVVNVGFDESWGERIRGASRFAASSGSNDNINYGTNTFSQSMRRNKLIDTYLVYNEKFSDLNVELTGGYSYQIFEARNFNSGNLNDPTAAATALNITDIPTDNVLLSYFARTNLSYKDKYLLTLSVRQDNSSRFSKNNRQGWFPAASFAWKLKDEFFQNNKAMSDLKLRVGYGLVGQQDFASANLYLEKYNIGLATSQYFFGNTAVPVALPERLNPAIGWETTSTFNAGIDYGFYDNRINGSIDLFYKDSRNLIVNGAVADGSNFSNRTFQNVGNFTTKGIEFSINADVVKTSDLNWNVNFNFTRFERRIETLIFGKDIPSGASFAGTGGNGQVLREGFTPDSFFVYKQLYANGQPIEGAYADLNADGIVNDQDRYIYRNGDPDATFGFASTLNYKNIDFSFNLRASIGNRVLNAVNAGRAQFNNLQIDAALSNIPVSVFDTNFQTTSNVVLSDIYVENASFLRVDNITLGYTFPNWLQGQASLRFFAGVQNPSWFLLTNYSGIDPEINGGIDNTIYPRQEQFLFGANIKF
jgi:TonB-linked SusC/RagA family outer membrane protein